MCDHYAICKKHIPLKHKFSVSGLLCIEIDNEEIVSIRLNYQSAEANSGQIPSEISLDHSGTDSIQTSVTLQEGITSGQTDSDYRIRNNKSDENLTTLIHGSSFQNKNVQIYKIEQKEINDHE